LQIRQVAHLVEHHMQPARAPRAKEHTNNPVQRPDFRGHATGDGEITRACGRLPPQARELSPKFVINPDPPKIFQRFWNRPSPTPPP